MKVTGTHRSQAGWSSSSGSKSQEHGMKATRQGVETQTCHTSTCLTGPSSRVLAKGVPNHVALLTQH